MFFFLLILIQINDYKTKLLYIKSVMETEREYRGYKL